MTYRTYTTQATTIVLAVLFTALLALLFVGVCESDVTRGVPPIEQCRPTGSFCMKFISTRIVECKYDGKAGWFVASAFLALTVALILLNYGECYRIVQEDPLFVRSAQVLTLVMVVGMCLIVKVDNSRLHGDFGTIRFRFENGPPPYALHLVGVLLVFAGALSLFVTVTISCSLQNSRDNLQQDDAYRFLYNTDKITETILFNVCICFGVAYFLYAVFSSAVYHQAAIVLEYLAVLGILASFLVNMQLSHAYVLYKNQLKV